MNLYVYYQVSPGDHAAGRAAAEFILRHVLAETGIGGRLLHRRDRPDTWMEVYEGIDGDADFERVPGAVRHVERFVPFEQR